MVSKRDIIEQFREGRNPDIIVRGAKSTSWLHNKVNKVLNAKKRRRVSAADIGRMFMFEYDAKYKEKLPIWDRFPLIIILDINNKYILGLNLHYIPPKMRQRYLEVLLKGSRKDLDEMKKVIISWGKVKGKQFSEQMVKLYLKTNIESMMLEIPPKEWINAIYLPSAQFIVSNSNDIKYRQIFSNGQQRRSST